MEKKENYKENKFVYYEYIKFLYELIIWCLEYLESTKETLKYMIKSILYKLLLIYWLIYVCSIAIMIKFGQYLDKTLFNSSLLSKALLNKFLWYLLSFPSGKSQYVPPVGPLLELGCIFILFFY